MIKYFKENYNLIFAAIFYAIFFMNLFSPQGEKTQSLIYFFFGTAFIGMHSAGKKTKK